MTGEPTRRRMFVAAVGTVGAILVAGPVLSGAPAGRDVAMARPAAAAAAGTATTGTAQATGGVPTDAAPGAVAGSPVHTVAFTTAAPGSAAAVAVQFALAQIGLPYVWGGDGPAAGDTGFDCSGLTHAAYATAGVHLPRTAQTQYDTGPHLPDGTALLPGDLVFYGTPTKVHHVGIAIDAHRMVNAPTFGKPVQVATIHGAGDDYVGATWPAAQPGAGSLGGAVAAMVLSAPLRAAAAALPTTSGPPAAAAPLPAAPAPVPPAPVTGPVTAPTGGRATVPGPTTPPATVASSPPATPPPTAPPPAPPTAPPTAAPSGPPAAPPTVPATSPAAGPTTTGSTASPGATGASSTATPAPAGPGTTP